MKLLKIWISNIDFVLKKTRFMLSAIISLSFSKGRFLSLLAISNAILAIKKAAATVTAEKQAPVNIMIWSHA
jgi:hypothetical protein